MTKNVFISNKKEERTRDLLDLEQNAILETILLNKDNMLITGKAGTGKSFLLRALLQESNDKTLQMAPTGVAAINIGGVTLHSAFGFYNLESIDIDDINSTTIRLKKEKREVLINAERLVVDEASMIRSDTFEKMDKILRIVCQVDTSFGGKQVVLFGDIFQLPPVVKNSEEFELNERFGGVHFFDTVSFRLGNFKFVELTINHRQINDTIFFDILNRIRRGDAKETDLSLLNERVVAPDSASTNGSVHLFPKKKEAENLNAYVLSKLPGKEYKFMANVWSKNKQPVHSIEKRFPITQCLNIKAGAQVMMTTNDPQKRWANGSMGIVEKIDRQMNTSDDNKRKGSWVITVRIGHEAYEIGKASFVEEEAIVRNGGIEYEPIIEVRQYPMILAWALTIHKSQGLTYDNVICSLEGCFSPGQAYVALSRCKTLRGLSLTSAVEPWQLIVDRDAVLFYESQSNNTSQIAPFGIQRRKTETEFLLLSSIKLKDSDPEKAQTMLHNALGRIDAVKSLRLTADDFREADPSIAEKFQNLANSLKAVEEFLC